MFDAHHLYVLAEPCHQCLFGRNKIVSDGRRDDVLAACANDGRHFTCHRATIADVEVVCAGFYRRYPFHTPAMRLAAMFPDRLFRRVRETADGWQIVNP